MFIESVDASSYSHTGDNLFKLFDQFIQKFGSDDVVQIVTDSASNNVLAGKFINNNKLLVIVYYFKIMANNHYLLII